MKTERMTSRIARDAVLLLDEDFVCVAREDEQAAEIAEIDALVAEELGDLAELDALVEEAEREWADAERVESFRVSRELTDEVRARRAHRRSDRKALRGLPMRLDVTGPVSGEAA